MTDESDAKPAAQVELDAQVKPGAQVKPAAKHKKSNALLNVMIAISAIAMIGALGLIAYPTFSDWWNRMHQSYAVAGYVEQTKDMSGAERKAMLDAAHAYNERLATNSDRWHMTDAQKREYDETLDVTGTGIMGYVTIPRIKVKLPVYHGTSDGVLQIAAGHLAGTSLPVGGATTHAVVSGHTGLPSARLLTGLDELKKGDTFAFHVLDETYTYQVDQISVVLPSEISKLNIESGADYATLITCTPYGVNSHRLLVRGHRIPNARQDAIRRAGRNDSRSGCGDRTARVCGWLRFCGARAAMATLLDCAARVVRRGRRAPFVWCSGVVSSLAPPQAGDIASPVCGGVRLVVLGMWCVVFVCLWYVLRFSVCTCVCVRVHV